MNPRPIDQATSNDAPPVRYEIDVFHDMSLGHKRRARTFALAQIKAAYGFDYRPDWHADLDTLAAPWDESWYAPPNGGDFVTVSLGDVLVATGGMHPMARRGDLLERLGNRYPSSCDVASIARVYVSPSHRRRGIASMLDRFLAVRAASMGYRDLYLHATTAAVETVEFWRGLGYREFARIGSDTHLDRHLRHAS